MSDYFTTPWTVACQAPLSMRFPRQEYWSGLPLLSLGESSPSGDQTHASSIADGFFTAEPSWKPPFVSHLRPNVGLAGGSVVKKSLPMQKTQVPSLIL